MAIDWTKYKDFKHIDINKWVLNITPWYEQLGASFVSGSRGEKLSRQMYVYVYSQNNEQLKNWTVLHLASDTTIQFTKYDLAHEDIYIKYYKINENWSGQNKNGPHLVYTKLEDNSNAYKLDSNGCITLPAGDYGWKGWEIVRFYGKTEEKIDISKAYRFNGEGFKAKQYNALIERKNTNDKPIVVHKGSTDPVYTVFSLRDFTYQNKQIEGVGELLPIEVDNGFFWPNQQPSPVAISASIPADKKGYKHFAMMDGDLYLNELWAPVRNGKFIDLEERERFEFQYNVTSRKLTVKTYMLKTNLHTHSMITDNLNQTSVIGSGGRNYYDNQIVKTPTYEWEEYETIIDQTLESPIIYIAYVDPGEVSALPLYNNYDDKSIEKLACGSSGLYRINLITNPVFSIDTIQGKDLETTMISVAYKDYWVRKFNHWPGYVAKSISSQLNFQGYKLNIIDNTTNIGNGEFVFEAEWAKYFKSLPFAQSNSINFNPSHDHFLEMTWLPKRISIQYEIPSFYNIFLPRNRLVPWNTTVGRNYSEGATTTWNRWSQVDLGNESITMAMSANGLIYDSVLPNEDEHIVCYNLPGLGDFTLGNANTEEHTRVVSSMWQTAGNDSWGINSPVFSWYIWFDRYPASSWNMRQYETVWDSYSGTKITGSFTSLSWRDRQCSFNQPTPYVFDSLIATRSDRANWFGHNYRMFYGDIGPFDSTATRVFNGTPRLLVNPPASVTNTTGTILKNYYTTTIAGFQLFHRNVCSVANGTYAYDDALNASDGGSEDYYQLDRIYNNEGKSPGTIAILGY